MDEYVQKHLVRAQKLLKEDVRNIIPRRLLLHVSV